MAHDHELDVLKAAQARANTDWSQEEIGKRLQLGGQAQVSRLLRKARENGYLVESFAFPPDVSPEVRSEVEASYLPEHGDLEKALAEKAVELSNDRSSGGAPFHRLHVVGPATFDASPEAAMKEAFLRYGPTAATVVSGYIDHAATVCVAWGRTIEATLRSVRPVTMSGSAVGEKTFLPIAGEPINHAPNGVSPSDAARILAGAWPHGKARSLRGVQARIPKAVDERDSNRIARELVGFSKNYQDIFGRPGSGDRLMSKVAMILTGLGDRKTSNDRPGDNSDPWYRETLDAEDPAVLELTVGNIGGVWLPRRGLPDADVAAVAEMNGRWLGATEEDFRRCANNASPEVARGRPGVVVLAVEPAKVDIVLESLHLINVLIVSLPLARALGDSLGVTSHRR